MMFLMRKCPSSSFLCFLLPLLSSFFLCLLSVPLPCLLLDWTSNVPALVWQPEAVGACCLASPPASLSCVPGWPHLHCVCVMSPVYHVVVPSVSEESPSASESGVLLSQDPSAKPVLLLPPKKPAAFSGDHEETPVKQLSLLKQPPALPPKPTARIANHLTGEWTCLPGCAALLPFKGSFLSLSFL